MPSSISSALPELPVEPNSRSEILAATHIFTLEITSLTASPWKAVESLEHRTLEMNGTVIERLKGQVSRDKFAFKADQYRDNPVMAMAYYGLWSHIEVTEGRRFLVIASSASNDPAAMMGEPACRGLLDASRREDVAAAIAAERTWQMATERGETAQVRALLESAAPYRARIEDVFGRYLGARLEPALYRHPQDLEPDVLTWISAPDVSPKLVLAGITAVDNVLVRLGRPAELVRPLVRELVDLAATERLATLRKHLLEVFLLNSIMPEDGKALSAHEALPDQADREKLAAMLSRLKSEQATELQAWLKRR